MRIFAVAAVALALIGGAHAQNYPSKPVRIINGFQPGGPTDIIGRVLADHMTKAMGQSFIVESKPGAAGNIAGDYVAKQPPDGYTLYLSAWSALVVNQALYPNLPFDPAKDFTPITVLATTPLPIDVSVKLPVSTYAEFVAYAKANPGKLNHGSPGIGSMPHLAAELFRSRVGFRSEHVPYRGSGPFATGIAQGEVQWGFDSANTALTLLKNGSVKIVAITGARRHEAFPDVPTLQELGMKDADWQAYFALVGPAGMPKEIVDKLYAEIARGWKDPEVMQRFRNIGFTPVGTTPQETARILERDRALWPAVVRENNIKVE